MFRCEKRRKPVAFRVSIHNFARAFRLNLEGALTAADVPEVEARWRTGSSIRGDRAFEADLRDVTAVDGEGRALLLRMREDGVEFIADSPESGRLVSEITGALPVVVPRKERSSLFRELPELLACLFSRLKALAS
ncbi:MAG: hypothetical protein LAQ30_28680 [Acidobacteriia bacterium]|nr:hypothetical protein [Terriglobia bacterium]